MRIPNQFKHAIGTTYVAFNPDIVGFVQNSIASTAGDDVVDRTV